MHHFLNLAQSGRDNPAASTYEKHAARLVAAVIDGVPGMDNEAVDGLCDLIRLAARDEKAAEEQANA